MRRLLAIATLALLANAPSDATEDAALRQASERGALLYAYDQSAWHGTDDMQAKLPAWQEKIAGYIVDGTAAAPRLIFFDRSSEPRMLYVAQFAGTTLRESHVVTSNENAAITPETLRMIAALRTARASFIADKNVKNCSNAPYNTVVLPPAGSGPIPVYFLTPSTVTGQFPMGGHFEVDVTSDKAQPVRRFTNSCIEAPGKGSPKKLESLVITQLIGTLPTEVHVFTSLAAHLPVLVIAGTPEKPRLWTVAGSTIKEERIDPTLLNRK